jgi:hypothetical protein
MVTIGGPVRRELAAVVRRVSRVRSNSLPTLLYIGGGGRGNLGDDVMPALARRLLAPIGLEMANALSRERRLGWLGLAGRRPFAGAVLGGGTLINPLWLPIVQWALAQGLPMWSLGTGAGSPGFVLPETVDLTPWKPVLSRFQAIGLRGPISAAHLLESGVTNVEVVGDLALTLARPALEPPADPPVVAVNLRTSPARSQNRELPVCNQVLPLLRGLLAQGWKIRPFALQDSDCTALRRLLSDLGMSSREPRVYDSVDLLIDDLAPCQLSVSVRLHGAVFSSCAGTPCLLLGYRDKCLDFMESMGMVEWLLSYERSSPQDVAHKGMELAAAAGRLRSQVLERAQHWSVRLEALADRIRSRFGGLGR